MSVRDRARAAVVEAAIEFGELVSQNLTRRG